VPRPRDPESIEALRHEAVAGADRGTLLEPAFHVSHDIGGTLHANTSRAPVLVVISCIGGVRSQRYM